MINKINIEDAEYLLRLGKKPKLDIYDQTYEEINLRLNMMVLITMGKLYNYKTYLIGKEVVIITHFDEISMPLHEFCSEGWKKYLLSTAELRRGIEQYNEEWLVKKRKSIKSSFIARLILTGIGLISVLLKGNMPLSSSIICWSGIFIMTLMTFVQYLYSKTNYKRIDTNVRLIKKQLQIK